MKLRDMLKTNFVNDGTRTLLESILIPEVERAFRDWVARSKNMKYVLIGGVALSYYVKPRTTTDVDTLFPIETDIPVSVLGFKRHRPGALQHDKTHVEVEILSPGQINMPVEIAKAIYDNALIKGGVRIASPSGLVVSKLSRFSFQDQADIAALIHIDDIDLTSYHVPEQWQARFDNVRDRIGADNI